MTRRPLSPMPRMDFTEEGRFARLSGQWQRLTNQADIVVEANARPQVDHARELAQLAIIKGVLGVDNPNNPHGMRD